MNIEDLRDYCLSLKGVTEKMPFGDKVLAFAVKDKLFCLTNIDTFQWVNLKCKPEKAIELRECYEEVIPAYHMNKKHWNSVNPKGRISDELLQEWIRNSYDLVVLGLTKKAQKDLLESTFEKEM